jgi:hypothetical protein
MKKIITILILLMIVKVLSGQSISKQNIEIQRAAPELYLNGVGGDIRYSGNIYLTGGTGVLTLSGANFNLGANSLLMTGSLASTGSRVLKGWFTNLEITNIPTVAGVSILANPSLTTLTLGGTLVTSTADELNKLHNVTTTAEQFDMLNGLMADAQQQLDLKLNYHNSIATGVGTFMSVIIGGTGKAQIDSIKNVGKGYEIYIAGAAQSPYLPPANRKNISTITTIPTIYSAAGDTSNQAIPGKIGNLFINTSNGKVFVSVTAARGGWVILN